MPVNIRGIMLVGATCALAVSAVAGTITNATAAPTATAPYCTGTGSIPATDLAAPVSLQNCPIQGRLVVRAVGSGRMGVLVPASGHGITENMATKSGDYTLSVDNKNGQITTTTSFPPAQAKRAASAAASPAATDPACNETEWNPEPWKWNKTLNWYFNVTTATSRAGLNGAAATSALRAGNSNITTGANNCGLPTGQFSAHGAYQGTTAKFANIDSAGECLKNDGQSTDSFGTINDTEDLSFTCTERSNGIASETDTYFGSNVGLATSCPPKPTGKWDLETNATHEWGHSFGLAHVSAVDEVMYDSQAECPSLRRHLGLGDWNGMDAIYP